MWSPLHRAARTLVLAGPAVLSIACAEQAPSPPAAASAGESTATAEPAEAREGTTSEVAGRLHLGLDVSMHSGTVDWAELAAQGHTFGFVKATEGVDLKDSAFDQHWREMKQAGMVRGAYHFYVTEDDPTEQARFFISTAAIEPGDLAPVVDVELIGHGTKAGLPERLRTWLEIVEDHYGVKPIIYTTAGFWDAHLTADFGDYPLWVAEYEVEKPRLPAGWSDWHLWQWKGDAEVSGVEKGADLSHVNRSGPELSRLVVPD